ncbi:MAG: ATP-binding protein [Myxococcota bacterium]|nr:ATP-binding protein [Myxococcota bacterium]
MSKAGSGARDAFEANARDVLRLYLVVTSVGATLYLAATAFVGPESGLYNALIVGLLAVNAACYWLFRIGQTRWSGTVLIATLWLVGVYPTAAEGLNSTAAINYLLVTATAGVVISGRAALVTGALSAALVVLVAWADGIGLIHPTPRDVPALTNGVGRALQLVVVAIFLWMTARNLRRAMARQRESRLRAELNEERVAELVRESPEGMITVGLDGVVSSANPAACRMLALDEGAVVGLPIRTLFDEGVPGEVWSAMFDGSAPARLELERGRGDEASVLEISPRVALRDGEPVVHATLRDVTVERRRAEERRVLQERLARTDRLDSVGRLAGGMAHDFNNLLTAISATAELVEPDALEASARADMREIRELCLRGSQLTRQLLSFARPQAIETTRFDLGALVDQLCPMLRRLVSERVRFEIETEPVWIEASRCELERVLVNLVVNAQDAMPRGGMVRIGVRAAEHAVLSVSDTGEGMDAETQARIFDPFFTTKGDAGTGLGLSIVHGLVNRMNGTIDVDSAPGRGTTFRVSLERSEARASTPLPPPRPVEAARAERILVLEDQPEVRRTTCRLLRREGYDVVSAADADAAREMLEQAGASIGLVVSDVVLPGQSGPELAWELRETRPDLRFVFVSGYTGDALDGEILGQLGAPFLSKPFTRDALLTQVARSLEGASTRASAGSRVGA